MFQTKPDIECFGKAFKALRKSKKMSLRALAKKIDFSITYISLVERGKSAPSPLFLASVTLKVWAQESEFLITTFLNQVVDQEKEKILQALRSIEGL